MSLLGAALYDPVWTTAVHGGQDVAIAFVGLLLLERWRLPPLAIVGFSVAASIVSALMT